MKRWWLQFVVLVLLAVFQFSFVHMAFSRAWLAPDILIAVAVLWVVRRDFRSVIGRIVVLGVLYDLVSGGTFGLTPLLLLWFAYITSFLSKRFLVEHSGSGLLIAGLLSSTFALLAIPLRRALSTIVPHGQVIGSSIGWMRAFLEYVPLAFVTNLALFFVLALFFARFVEQPFSDTLDPLFRG